MTGRRFIILAATLATLVAVISTRRPLFAQDPDPRIVATRPAVVRVAVTGRDSQGDNRSNTGTGFFVTPEGHFLTAAHVLQTEAGWAENVSGQPEMTITVKMINRTLEGAIVLYSDPQTDLALLRVDPGDLVRAVELGDSSTVDDGSDVIAFGFETQVVPHRGFVSMAFDARYSGVFRLDITAQEGDSGGPVIDDEGQVVGVIRAGLVDRPGRTYATPINFASNLLHLIQSPQGPAARYTIGSRDHFKIADSSVPQRLAFSSRDYDTDDAVKTGVSWQFVAPRGGIYNVSAAAHVENTQGAHARLVLMRNDTAVASLGMHEVATSDGDGLHPSGSTDVQVKRGDALWIGLEFHQNGNASQLSSRPERNWIAIHFVRP